METTTVIYWIITGLLAAAMTFSAYTYLTQPVMKATFEHLGYPAHFRRQLAVAKLLGAVVLIAPVGPLLKEWAYVGFAFTFISASVSHIAMSDPLSKRVVPLVMLLVLAVSYVTYHNGLL